MVHLSRACTVSQAKFFPYCISHHFIISIFVATLHGAPSQAMHFICLCSAFTSPFSCRVALLVQTSPKGDSAPPSLSVAINEACSVTSQFRLHRPDYQSLELPDPDLISWGPACCSEHAIWAPHPNYIKTLADFCGVKYPPIFLHLEYSVFS